MEQNKTRTRQGIQSIEIGSRLLQALVDFGRPTMLRDLALAAGMPAAKAHRYLVSFIRMGLVAQEQATSRYTLGPFAVSLGLASLALLDPIRLATPVLEELCEKIGETVALAVWGTHGATIVRQIDPGGPIAVVLRTGAVLPLATSATGRAFLAFHRAPYMRELLERETRELSEKTGTSQAALREDLDNILADTRARGIARASGSLTPGINGFSAPVFDHTGSMVAAITSLGAVGHFDTEWNSPLAITILEAADQLSRLLGQGKD